MSLSQSSDFYNFYSRVREIIDDARGAVYREINLRMLRAYWEIGREIVVEEQKGKSRAEYGNQLIENLALKLKQTYGKGFNKRNLFYMRKFYQVFPIVNALRSQLSWTHYRILLRVDKPEAREFYLEEAIASNWSTRQLDRQVTSLYFERMLMSRSDPHSLAKKKADINEEEILASDYIKDPFVLEFLDLKGNTGLYESKLEQALIDKLQGFLLELGRGFSFVSRQYRVSSEKNNFYIDLVFYNYILNCFLLVDLKSGRLNHQDIGQMDFYVRFFEDKIRQEGDNPTIGLILCTEKDSTIVKYSVLSECKQIFASKYKLYMPDVKVLQEEIKKEREFFHIEQGL
jgi:predicted nuclease of restriction endonuclease-like (RecB) superfamily